MSSNKKLVLNRPDYSGKIFPQAVELEASVLGSLMLEKSENTKTIIAIINPNVFYTDQHKFIAEAIVELKKEGIHPDVLSVTERVKKHGNLENVGGAYYITLLTDRCVPINCEFHYRVVQQKYVQREFIKIMHEKIGEAFDDSCDIFDLLETAERQLRYINPVHREVWEQSSKDIVLNVEAQIIEPPSTGIFMYYNTGWPVFDKYIGTARNKVIVVGGAAGHGKSRFVSSWMFNVLDQFAKDISIFWCTFEDSAEDILLFYLSNKVKVKAKYIKKRNFNKDLIPELKKHIKKFNTFDIHFIDRWDKIAKIKQKFELFCDRRPDKFPVLIIDNLLSLRDRQDFKGAENSMYDYVMAEILSIRQNTRALIIIVHHFNDAQLSKERLKDGYRPTVQDLKGTEAIRRVANQVLLINNPKNLKDLVAEYHDDQKKILQNLFIVDPGKIRDDSNTDEESLIHFWHKLDYLIFKEIPKYPQGGGK